MYFHLKDLKFFLTGGWNLGLAPVYTVNSLLPPDIKLINTGDEKFPFNVLCLRCDRKIGKVNAVCGFEEFSINFSATKVILLQEKYTSSASATSAKWSKVIGQFPQSDYWKFKYDFIF